jgi:hypothetical protein
LPYHTVQTYQWTADNGIGFALIEFSDGSFRNKQAYRF